MSSPVVTPSSNRGVPYVPETLSARLLLGLWIVWAGLLFGGFILGGESETNRIPQFNRMASSATLVVAALVGFAAARGTPARRFALLVALGMTLGLIGDLFNANLIQVGLPNPVMGAIVAFGLGHVAYIWACFDIEARAGFNKPRRRNLAIAAWLLVGAIGWYFVAWSPEKSEELMWPALPYSLLLAGTAGITSGLALQNVGFTAMAFGGALFLLSDLILAWRLFQGSFYLAGDAVWLTYGPGQMLIVYSIVSAMIVVRKVDGGETVGSA